MIRGTVSSATVVTISADRKPQLVRAMTRLDLAGLAINGIIGAGIFGIPSSAARLMGVSSPVAFVACAVIALLFILCFAEVASQFSDSGGPYLYARRTLGRFVAFEVGWSMWLARVSSFAANTNVFLAYLGFFLPWTSQEIWRVLVLIAVPGVLAVINIRGVGTGAHLADVLGIAKVSGLALFGLAGLFFVDWSRFSAFTLTPTENWGPTILLVLYAFTGFESAVIPAAEARNPQRDLGAALIGALAVSTLVYVAVQLVALGTVAGLSESERPLADSAMSFIGPVGGALISLMAMTSVIGNLSASMLVSPRVTYALAEESEVPAVFGRLHPVYRTPVISIAFFAAVCAVLAASGTFVWLATISVMARLVAYGITCLAVPLLRRGTDTQPSFRLWGGPIIPALAVSLTLWLFTQTAWSEVVTFVLAMVGGGILYLVGKTQGNLGPSRA